MGSLPHNPKSGNGLATSCADFGSRLKEQSDVFGQKVLSTVGTRKQACMNFVDSGLVDNLSYIRLTDGTAREDGDPFGRLLHELGQL